MDKTPYAYYFQQAGNGIFARQALLSLVLNETFQLKEHIMTQDHKLLVEAIKCGTVIDHIPANVGFKLLSFFRLTETDSRITIGLNLPSNNMGRKDLIKLEDTFLTPEQANQLGFMPLKPQLILSKIIRWLKTAD